MTHVEECVFFTVMVCFLRMCSRRDRTQVCVVDILEIKAEWTPSTVRTHEHMACAAVIPSSPQNCSQYSYSTLYTVHTAQ